MCVSKPKTPKAPPVPPPAPEVTEITSEDNVKYAKGKERKKLAAMAGRQSTILTGGLGDTSAANVQKKTLLG